MILFFFLRYIYRVTSPDVIPCSKPWIDLLVAFKMKQAGSPVQRDISNYHSSEVVVAVIVISFSVWLAITILRGFRATKTTKSSTLDFEKPISSSKHQTKRDGRPPRNMSFSTTSIMLTEAIGEERISSDFKRPTPSPYPHWNIETTNPIPYRPFRYGP
jgi:hypothetical protein